MGSESLKGKVFRLKILRNLFVNKRLEKLLDDLRRGQKSGNQR